MDNIIWGAVLALAFVPVVFYRCKKIKYISVAEECSQYFAGCKVPFVNVENLPVSQNKKRGLQSIRGAIIGAADEHYKCRYCGNVIMRVVQQKRRYI